MIKNDIITFPTETIFGDELIYQLNITYSNDESGTYQQNNYSAETKGLSIKDHGSNLIDYDLNERVLIPSETTIKVNDALDYLDSVLFNGNVAISSFTLTITKNNILEYSGKFLKNPIDNISNEKEITLTFITDIDLLNTTMVRDQDEEYTNPLEIEDISMWNPEGDIINGQSIYLTKLTDLIKRVYQHINPNVTFSVNHNWLFHGVHITDYSHIYDTTIEDLYVKMEAFYSGEDSLSDCLKKFCMVFFAKTGMPSNDKAFFRKLYYYSSGNRQDIEIIGIKKHYKYDTIRYLVSKDTAGNIRQELPSAELYTLEEYSKIETEYHESDLLIYIIKNNKTYLVSEVKDTDFDNDYHNFPGFHNELLYDKRSQMKYNREDVITAKGLEIDYQKNFLNGDSKYEISTMEKFYGKGITKIDALYLGEL